MNKTPGYTVRIGPDWHPVDIGFTPCEICHAVIATGPDYSGHKAHKNWHEKQERTQIPETN